QARLIGADRDVVGAEADEELAHYATADHSELAARVVGDVDVVAVQRARRNVGRAEAAQDAAYPQRGRVDERHGAGANAYDGRCPAADGDVLRVGRHAKALDDATGRQVDGHELVRRLGRDERDNRAPARAGLR